MMMSGTNIRERAEMYRLLQRLYRVETDGKLLSVLKSITFPEADGLLGEGYAMMKRYLDCCGENALEELAADYAGVFLAAGSADGAAAIPCESVYTGTERLFMQEAWEEVRSIYREKGLALNGDMKDLMEDHIAAELEFMAFLTETGDTEAQKDFLEKHLLNWVPDFTEDIERYARKDFYKAVGRITLGFLSSEEELLDALSDGRVKQSRSYSVRSERMADILARLKEKYRVYAPKRFPKRGPKGTDLIRYGEIDTLTDIVYKEKSHFSPKEVFYPVSQTMFRFKDKDCEQQELKDDRGILLICRACDINAVRRLDTIFLNNGQPDLYYSRIREKLKLVLLECTDSFENCFCVSMGTNTVSGYAAAISIDDICARMEICDEELLPYFEDEVPAVFTPGFVTENRRQAKLPEIDRSRLGEICAMDYWKKFDEECIACGGCNTVCPTCACFDTVDIIYNETSMDGERRRVWSACMLKDFTQTAGGGMARKTQGANMRFKVLHKIYDYKERFGTEHMCVGCGRCIDRCPKGIDFLDTVNGLSELLEKEAD